MSVRGLESLDGCQLDGLEFCTRAYTAFDQIRSHPRGVEELRLLTSKRAKRLVEEVMPITRYIQARYSPACASESDGTVEASPTMRI